jgi:glutamine synthetase
MALELDKTLVKSGVFTKNQLESYLEVKRDEAKQALMYPTPADYAVYGDM